MVSFLCMNLLLYNCTICQNSRLWYFSCCREQCPGLNAQCLKMLHYLCGQRESDILWLADQLRLVLPTGNKMRVGTIVLGIVLANCIYECKDKPGVNFGGHETLYRFTICAEIPTEMLTVKLPNKDWLRNTLVLYISDGPL